LKSEYCGDLRRRKYFYSDKTDSAGAQMSWPLRAACSICSSRKKVNVSAINWLVLDEADEMLDMGFKDDLNAIFIRGTPDQKRVLLFSATMPSGIEALARSYMKSPRKSRLVPKTRARKIFSINITSCMPRTGM